MRQTPLRRTAKSANRSDNYRAHAIVIFVEFRKRKRWLIALIATMASFGFWFVFLQNTEPTFHGKPLSYWIKMSYWVRVSPTSMQQSDGIKRAEAKKAIRTIGTNGLPFLVKWVTNDAPAWRRNLWSHISAGPSWLKRSPMIVWIGDDGTTRYLEAKSAFEELGPIAAPAIPTLARAAKTRSNMTLREKAIGALLSIGPPALPALTNFIAETSSLPPSCHREWINLLKRELYAEDPGVASSCAGALGELKLYPGEVVPALIEAAKRNNPSVRAAAVKSLGRYGREAASALPTVRALLNDSNSEVRNNASVALAAITRYL